MDGGGEAAQQLLFSQVAFYIVQSEGLKSDDAQIVSVVNHGERCKADCDSFLKLWSVMTHRIAPTKAPLAKYL